jgi:hypothetical protein
MNFSSTVIPVQMILMPLFRGYVKFGLYDSRVGMIIVYTAPTVAPPCRWRRPVVCWYRYRRACCSC